MKHSLSFHDHQTIDGRTQRQSKSPTLFRKRDGPCRRDPISLTKPKTSMMAVNQGEPICVNNFLNKA